MVTTMTRTRFWGSRFWILFGAGLLGVLSTWFLPLNLPPDFELPMSETALRLIGLVQSSILLLIAVALGQFFAPKAGLRAPVADALAAGRPGDVAWRSLILPGVVWGGISVLVISGLASLLSPLLPEAFVTAGEQSSPPAVVRLLYGGITEEILLRWGVMSLLAWAIWRIGQRGQGQLSVWGAWLAIGGTALLFGVGHLPAAASLAGPSGLTPALIAYIISLNALFGLGAGWLFWRRGLEAAIVAHMMFHIVALVGEWVTGLF